MSTRNKKPNWSYFDVNADLVDFPESTEEFTIVIDDILVEITQIVEFYKGLKEEMGLPPIYHAKSVLKRLVYQLVDECHNAGWVSALKEEMERRVVANGGRFRKDSEEDDLRTVFYMCLRGLDPNQKWVKSGEASRLAKQLSYAHDYEVPQEYLIGFTYQYGGDEVITFVSS